MTGPFVRPTTLAVGRGAQSAHGPHPAPDPARAAEDALALLDTGRTSMAATVFRSLPALIRDALSATSRRAEALDVADRKLEEMLATCDRAAVRLARAEAEAEVARREAEARNLDARLARARRELAAVEAALARRRRDLERPPTATRAPRRPKPHEVLSQGLASGAVTAEEVAEVLRVTPRAVREIASGKVGLARPSWRRVLATIDARRPGPAA